MEVGHFGDVWEGSSCCAIANQKVEKAESNVGGHIDDAPEVKFKVDLFEKITSFLTDPEERNQETKKVNQPNAKRFKTVAFCLP